jgi:serine/threonine protein kinase
MLGQQIGHIRIVDLLGEGGMGAVYVGFDDTLQRKVAVKAIRSESRLSPNAKARFVREARILSQLDHPSVCTVHDYIEGDDNDLLVMELVDGVSLRDALDGGLDGEARLEVSRQLLAVLVEVHGQGLIHRDLKPENVMLRPDGSIKVLDFGLSRSAVRDPALSTFPTLGPDEDAPPVDETGPVEPEAAHTELGVVLGTAGYMSPEQARGEPASPASDMYSAGLML